MTLVICCPYLLGVWLQPLIIIIIIDRLIGLPCSQYCSCNHVRAHAGSDSEPGFWEPWCETRSAVDQTGTVSPLSTQQTVNCYAIFYYLYPQLFPVGWPASSVHLQAVLIHMAVLNLLPSYLCKYIHLKNAGGYRLCSEAYWQDLLLPLCCFCGLEFVAEWVFKNRWSWRLSYLPLGDPGHDDLSFIYILMQWSRIFLSELVSFCMSKTLFIAMLPDLVRTLLQVFCLSEAFLTLFKMKENLQYVLWTTHLIHLLAYLSRFQLCYQGTNAIFLLNYGSPARFVIPECSFCDGVMAGKTKRG